MFEQFFFPILGFDNSNNVLLILLLWKPNFNLNFFLQFSISITPISNANIIPVQIFYFFKNLYDFFSRYSTFLIILFFDNLFYKKQNNLRSLRNLFSRNHLGTMISMHEHQSEAKIIYQLLLQHRFSFKHYNT